MNNPYNQYQMQPPVQPYAPPTRPLPISKARNIIAKVGVALMAVLMIVAVFIPAIESSLADLVYQYESTLTESDKISTHIGLGPYSVGEIVIGSISSVSGSDWVNDIETLSLEDFAAKYYPEVVQSNDSSNLTLYDVIKIEVKQKISGYESSKKYASDPTPYDEKIKEAEQILIDIDNNAALKTFCSKEPGMSSTTALLTLITAALCAVGMLLTLLFVLLPYKKSLRVAGLVSGFVTCGSAAGLFFVIYSAFCSSTPVGMDSAISNSSALKQLSSMINIGSYTYNLNVGIILFLAAAVLLFVFSALGVRYTSAANTVPAAPTDSYHLYQPPISPVAVPPVQQPFPAPSDNIPVIPQTQFPTPPQAPVPTPDPVRTPVYDLPQNPAPVPEATPLNVPNSNDMPTTVLSGNESKTVAQVGHIEGIKGEYAGAAINFFPEERIIIGRNPDLANIVINAPSVSRKHCEIIYDPLNNCYKVINYSTNGVIVDHKNKLPKDQKVRVNANTEISIGNEDNVFRLG